MKDVRSQRIGGLSSADKGGGVVRCGQPHLGAKSFEFFEIYGVRTDEGGGVLSRYGYFSDKR